MTSSVIHLSSLVKSILPPSESVKAWLRKLPKSTGIQLFDQLRRASSFIKEGIASGPHPDTTKLLVFSLRDVHALILELDDDVTDALCAEHSLRYRSDEVTAERCRSWLQQLQSFVVAVQKDLEILLATSSSSSLQRPLASSSILSSPAMSSISLSAGGSTAGSCCSSDADVEMTDVHADAHSVRHGQWDVLLRHTIDSLAVLLADDATMMAMQQGFDMPGMLYLGSPSQTKAKLSKLVCRRSALPYRDFWASKPAI